MNLRAGDTRFAPPPLSSFLPKRLFVDGALGEWGVDIQGAADATRGLP